MKSKSNTDLVLWGKLKDGNIEALGRLYDVYIDEMFSYGMQFCADKTKVMDHIHDVFLNLYKYRKSLANTNQVKYYLFRSLKNQILNTTKKTRSTQTYVLSEDVHANAFSNSIEDEIISTEFHTERTYVLTKAINSLSKKQRRGLFLRFTEEREYEEIAEIMNVSIQTSRTIIYRAIKALRKSMVAVLFVLLSIFY
ncbi:RNA polymerase sigma factor [Winogradskyella thalassocola]|uniref:Sigma-70 region 2 n=1 Tax=Winogradskyella thalassocola TaxID=262004 RepID=A0A1G8LMK2_9FLAO|nr:sigma-70 family RNA polymerase sigma factor [Winogradskyella thalassocola]SDI56845.1 Sigma-70 region 2 [Winogradskyella thalassocola]